jgi:DNA-binding NarL/FixJ family response regulator
MTPIQLLLVDDHILFRESLGRLLTSEADFDVAGDCGTTSEACAIVERCTIDVILLDFDLAGTPASQCIPALRRAGYEGQILMVTAGMTADESTMALRLGASGVFLKQNSPSMLTQAIRLVAGGATWVDPHAMRLMGDRGDRPATGAAAGVAHGQDPLTERERRVLQGVFEGLGNKEVGARLGVSVSAVKSTLQQLFHKTGVRTRSQLVRIALERSLATTDARRPGHADAMHRVASQKIDGRWPTDASTA